MIPLSHAQQRLWFLGRDGEDGAQYSIPVGLRLRGTLDRDALGGALADVTDRHEALRTLFPDEGGRPRQEVLAAGAAWPDLAVTPCAPGERERLVAAALRQPFDLAAEIPLRAHLFAHGDEEHYLLLVLHHIAGDGRSLDLLVRDLAAAYTARVRDEHPEWPELTLQYPDFAIWQRELLGDAGDPASLHSRQLAHWTRVLEGLPEELELPTDRPRPPVASHRGALVTALLDPALHTALADLAQARRATPFMAVQSAFAALLTRLGAGTDLPLGCPVDGRDDEALDDVVGLFVHTLVVRADTSGDPTFELLLDRVRDAVLDAHAHQDVPFEALVERLNPARSASRHPLFQVAVAGQRGAGPDPELPGLSTRVEAVRTATAKFDLTLEVDERRDPATGAPAGIRLALEYAGDLFDAATAQGLLDRLVRLTAAAVHDPAAPIAALDVLAPEERAELLEGRPTGPARPRDDRSTVHGLFARRAAEHPGRTAVVCVDREATYGELDLLSDAVADRLEDLGVRPGDAVAVLMERSVELIAACLGVLKAGAAYLPLDARAPRARSAAVVGGAGAAVLVTDSARPDAELVEALGVGRVLRPHRGTEPVRSARTAARGPGHADALAYVMYTSGSTGTPKGVAVPHREVVALARDSRWHGGAHERVLFRSPHAFDASTYELWVPLLNGGLVVVAPPGDLDVAELARLIADRKVTGTFLTATLFNVLADAHLPELASLREVMTGGEAASPPMVRRVREACPDTTVTNAYGPTETTTFSATFPIAPGRPVPEGRVPIGRPLDGTRLYVLDDRLDPVPPGVAGDLYIAGSGLAQGYLGRPALTAERFVACPHGPAGERMYRTGDRARWNASGELEYLGRADRQVKIRGLRIEPGEIESVLAAHPAVGQAAVTVVTGPAGPALAGYAVPADGAETPDAAALREHLAAALPDYMVPGTITLLDRFPVTPNGKIDTGALPAPGPAAPDRAHVAPRTETERVLCAVWESVLGYERIGVRDNFFDLGGHSLLATRLLAEVRSALGTTVGIRAFFAAPTVERMAGALAASAPGTEGAPTDEPAVVRRPRRPQTG
ncbi:non-ribosomal peptide synthetase [Streptomyces sp. A1136]|uniref:non-ribosomal peptide synthetase n=1 Tax=Streptomyces sp. A1136 TaxID=2563102 RepID=UPI001446288B|nr:non-ribosomal peptide synthetase [Streptomyces sp. A1136]